MTRFKLYKNQTNWGSIYFNYFNSAKVSSFDLSKHYCYGITEYIYNIDYYITSILQPKIPQNLDLTTLNTIPRYNL